MLISEKYCRNWIKYKINKNSGVFERNSQFSNNFDVLCKLFLYNKLNSSRILCDLIYSKNSSFQWLMDLCAILTKIILFFARNLTCVYNYGTLTKIIILNTANCAYYIWILDLLTKLLSVTYEIRKIQLR